MQDLALLLEPIRIWIDGGAWADIAAAKGFRSLVGLMAFLIPSTVIALGIGLSEWRETPLATWLGVDPVSRNEGWAERARDLDKDGMPDF